MYMQPVDHASLEWILENWEIKFQEKKAEECFP